VEHLPMAIITTKKDIDTTISMIKSIEDKDIDLMVEMILDRYKDPITFLKGCEICKVFNKVCEFCPFEFYSHKHDISKLHTIYADGKKRICDAMYNHQFFMSLSSTDNLLKSTLNDFYLVERKTLKIFL
jgi:hypothetical protein